MKATRMKQFRYPLLGLCAVLLGLGAYSLATRPSTAQAQPHVPSQTPSQTQSQPQGQSQPQAQASETPKAAAHFEAGVAAYQANDLPLAYTEFLSAAKDGHADSQFNLAMMYERGIGVGKDEKEAFLWYQQSASQGNAAAQFNLGVLYENGRGTQVDFVKANQWYRKASLQGDALAIGNLGMLYVRGQGVKQNKVAGVALLMVSATQDPSPENTARQNLAAIRGLTPEMVTQAQALSKELTSAKDLLVPLDRYLEHQGQH